jgi:disulfide bond formation protein DsbB
VIDCRLEPDVTRTPFFTFRHHALAIAIVATLTIGGALVFQHVLGYQPCKLCLEQRYPYYLGIPVALAAAFLPSRVARMCLYGLAAIFLASAVLGAYHAGVEWGFWLGPSDCGGPSGAASGSVSDMLSQLNRIRVVSCTEAAWRFLGLSLAGWNVLISVGLAVLALLAVRAGKAYGSSSLSQ